MNIVKELFGVPITFDPDCPPDAAYLMPKRNTVSYPNPRQVFVVGSVPSRAFVEAHVAIFRSALANHHRFYSDTPQIMGIDPEKTPLLKGELRVTWRPTMGHKMIMWAKRLFGVHHWTDTLSITEATPGPGTGGTHADHADRRTGAEGSGTQRRPEGGQEETPQTEVG